jgi:hypothetical protein
MFVKNAACQELSNALYNIVVARTIDLMELSKAMY